MTRNIAEKFAASAPESILIVLMGAIGDVVRGLPVAVQLKKHWPETRITWAVEPISKPLVEKHPAIDRVVCFRRGGGLSAYREFVSELRLESYEICLDLQRHFKSGFTSLCSGASFRLGFDRENSREGNWLMQTHLISSQDRFSPKIRQFSAFLSTLGIEALPDSETDFGLASTADVRESVAEMFQRAGLDAAVRPAAFLLSSTWPSRNWFAESYAELASKLRKDYGIPAVLLGTAADREFAARIIEIAADAEPMDLAGQTSLSELVAVLEQSSFAVGPDSGPMHIAAAVGTPVISLWGATSPQRSGPLGSEHLMLQSPIGCSPCYRRTCPGLDRLCMSSIPVEAVIAQLAAFVDVAKSRG